MMEARRFVLLIGLALVLMLLVQAWLQFQAERSAALRAPDVAAPATGLAPGEVPDTPRETAAPAATSTAAVPGAPQALAGDAPAAPGAAAAITVETDLLRVTIGVDGGVVRRVELLGYPVAVEQPDEPFVLLKEDGDAIFTAQTGLIGRDGDYPTHKTRFRHERSTYRLTEGAAAVEVPLYWTSPAGVSYTKVLRLHRDSYRMDIRYEIANRTTAPWEGYLYAQFRHTPIPTDGGLGFFGRLPSYNGGAIYTPAEKYEKIDFSDMEEGDLARDNLASGWVAVLQHYFVGAWLPEPGGLYGLYTSVLPEPGGLRYNIGYKTLTPLRMAPGASGTLGTRLFVGPKEQQRLKRQDIEGLLLTVDYGWLTPVAAPLFWVLSYIHGLSGNWGYAIILLTLLIKIVFYPLSAASYKSMARMKKFQPRLKTLRERHGNDRQKLNQEMMQLYKQEKINPLGGCLPILVQIPVFIALYWVLLESVELRQADFVLWLRDLSLPDPYYVLPLLMGGSMVVQQFLNPAPLDPMQKNIMMAMPVVFTVLFLWFPAGLVLYWVVNNILSIAQQWYITRRITGKT